LARSLGMPLTISGYPDHIVQLNSERFHEVSFVDPFRRRDYYLFVRLARGSADGLKELAAAPALYQVKTPDGAILCTVVPGRAYGELEALLSQRKQKAARRGGEER
jgi:hypothetical protein